MTDFALLPSATPSVAVAGTQRRFPIHRIYCVGLNYADHIREFGRDPQASPPIFFMKPADAVVANEEEVPYPPSTSNFHYEIELVVALGRGGRDVAPEQALSLVFGYAAGNDLTRRDLQKAAKDRGEPWDTSKGFDASAPLAAIRPVSEGHVNRGRIWLSLYQLAAGDLIFTGTPAGVGPVKPGDRLEGGIEGLEVLRNTIGPPAQG